MGKRGLVGAVQFGLHHVDGATSGVALIRLSAEVVHRGKNGDHRVEHALRDLVTVSVADRRRGHQQPDVADQHERAPGDPYRRSVNPHIVPVLFEHSGEHPALLRDLLGQASAHQAEPVAVARRLVVGVDGRDRILEVHDGGDRRLDHDVAQPRGVGCADRPTLPPKIDAETMTLEQYRPGARRVSLVGAQLGRVEEMGGRAVGERDHEPVALHCVPPRTHMRARRKRDHLVEVATHPLNDDRSPSGVVGPRLRRCTQHVGAIDGIVYATPSSVGGIERISDVAHRHNKLRPCYRRDLSVDVLGCQRELRACWDYVAEVLQESPICHHISRTVTVRYMPLVDRSLHPIARLEQLGVAWTE